MNEKSSIALIRNSNQKKIYQELSDNVSAVEPPYWMMIREQMLIKEKYEVFILDNEVENLSTQQIIKKLEDNKVREIEIFPTGNHPSSFIQHREGIELFAEEIKESIKKTYVKFNLDFLPVDVKSCWDSFDLQKYRAHNWHCNWNTIERKPYAVVCTSIGCPFNCSFCTIKTFYNTKYFERPINIICKEFDDLAKKGVKNIKILDELFFFKKERVENICEYIISKGYDFNIWAYARIDTINPSLLQKLKKAGFNWLAIGIESGNENIRKGSMKGKFTNRDILSIVSIMKDVGIYVVGNFIFGFIEDNMDTMIETREFARELKCEFSNLYSMMAYPGSKLYKYANESKWDLPKDWSAYSQYSYNCHPVRTKYLTSAEVLKFRDDAFLSIFEDNNYQEHIKKIFGEKAVEEIQNIIKIKLCRKLLEK
jgi:anaerobic magnesium-protoporphyrin IX monomethyl ester cyclase